MSQQRVGLPIRRQARQIDRGQGFQGLRNTPAAQYELPHMRDIEEPRLLPGVAVLGNNPVAVLNGHVIAGKRRHARAEFTMKGIQWRAFQGHGSSAPST